MFLSLSLVALSIAAEPVPVPDDVLIDARYERLMSPARAGWREAALARKQELQPIFDEALADRDLPDELLAVAFFESGFDNIPQEDPRPSGGVWQFIQPTARSYGLVVDGSTDERMDVAKSTGAALDLLDDLHTRFDDWGLAFAAYNVGPQAVQAAIDAHGTDDWVALVNAGALPHYPADVMAAVRFLDATDARR